MDRPAQPEEVQELYRVLLSERTTPSWSQAMQTMMALTANTQSDLKSFHPMDEMNGKRVKLMIEDLLRMLKAVEGQVDEELHQQEQIFLMLPSLRIETSQARGNFEILDNIQQWCSTINSLPPRNVAEEKSLDLFADIWKRGIFQPFARLKQQETAATPAFLALQEPIVGVTRSLHQLKLSMATLNNFPASLFARVEEANRRLGPVRVQSQENTDVFTGSSPTPATAVWNRGHRRASDHSERSRTNKSSTSSASFSSLSHSSDCAISPLTSSDRVNESVPSTIYTTEDESRPLLGRPQSADRQPRRPSYEAPRTLHGRLLGQLSEEPETHEELHRVISEPASRAGEGFPLPRGRRGSIVLPFVEHLRARASIRKDTV